jgi:asparagine synthase (glutamine-hydrolysing)
MMVRDWIQEARELGARGTLSRVAWEFRIRSGLAEREQPRPPRSDSDGAADVAKRWLCADPPSVAAVMSGRMDASAIELLTTRALEATKGTIHAFRRWEARFGDPPDWHLNPTTAERWDPRQHWSRVLRDEARVGDAKITWEIARFPHAYLMARAAAFRPSMGPEFAPVLVAQMRSFLRANPVGYGIHWVSGQEVAVRLVAWLFALDTFLARTRECGAAQTLVAQAMAEGAPHVERFLMYAERAVYNNHLLADALCLYAAGTLFPDGGDASRWRTRSLEILERESERQFYRDGAYIQLSFTYHRVAVQYLLWAAVLSRAAGHAPAPRWIEAIDRSVQFLVAHQCPSTGQLPNYGANDGALPLVLSTCDYSDFRPTLQAASIFSRGERLYDAGPWDEEAAWLLGPYALDAPLRPPARRTTSFFDTGFHVLRGGDQTSFATFRCGTIHDRFSQIDMLHVDVFWRGHNVLVDAGTYSYSEQTPWQRHFYRTAAHNTVLVDGVDQMRHWRRFKNLYWTKAATREVKESTEWAYCAGEHYGYSRRGGGVIHQRAVVFVRDDLWVVYDRLQGAGTHRARLHWLGGDFPYQHDIAMGMLKLTTPNGDFSVLTLDEEGRALEGKVVAGHDDPPEGWLSRYYGDKQPVPSLSVAVEKKCPISFVTVLGAGTPRAERLSNRWRFTANNSAIDLVLEDGLMRFPNGAAS